MAYRAGTAFVSVVPSLRGFQAQVARGTRGLSTTVRVDVDDAGIAGLGQRLNRLSKNVTAKVGVDVDSAGLSLLDRMLGRVDGRRVRASAEVDVVGALRDVAMLAVAINQFANRSYKFRVEADTAGAVASVALLVSKVMALGGLAGAAGGLAGALAGIAPAGLAAVAGIGSVVAAFNGVGTAYKALSDQQKKSVTEGADAARKQAQQAQQVQSAEINLGRANAAVSRARRDSARDVADAERAAAEKVTQAREAVVQAGERVEDAIKDQRASYRALDQATGDVRMAQAALTGAWEDGRRALEDLQDQADSTVLDQREAALDLEDALQALREAQATGNGRDIERAQLAYDRQVETIDQLSKRAARLKVDNTEAQAAGVAGTEQVISANGRLASAQESQSAAAERAHASDAAVAKARADQSKAQLAAVTAERDAADSVARARESASEKIQSAEDSAADAVRALAAAQLAAADSASSSADTVTQALADLNPMARQFAMYLFSLKPLLDGLSETAANRFFPSLMRGMDALVAQGPAITGIVGDLAGAMGTATEQVLTQLASPEWIGFFQLIATGAQTWLPMMADSGMRLAAVLRDLLIQLMPLAPAGFDLLNQLIALLAILSPFIVTLLGGLIPAASALLTALEPLGPVLAALQPILLVLGQAFAQVLMAVLQALAPILVALTPLIVAFAQSWANGIVNTLTIATPLLVAVAGFLSQHAGLIVTLTGVIGGFVAGANPLLWVLGLVVSWLHGWLIIRVVTAALAAFGLQGTLFGRILLQLVSPLNLLKQALPFIGRAIAMIGRSVLGAMGPIGWLLMIFGFLYSSNEQFRNSINGLLGVIMGLVGQLLGALMPAVNSLLGALMPVVDVLIAALIPIFNVLAGVILQVVMAVLPPLISILQTAVIPIIVILAGILTGVLVWVINNVVIPILNLLVWVLTNIVIPVILWLANNIIVPAFTLIGQIILWVVQNVVMPLFNALVWFVQNVLGPIFLFFWRNIIEPAWTGVGNAIRWVWENVIKPAWDAIMGGLTWLQDGFRSAVDWIGQKWNELRGLLARPINFLIGTVWNQGILVAWNKVAEFLPGIEPIAPLGLIPELATGGLLRGPGTGTSDDILALDSRGLPAARVSNGEYVVNAAVTKRTLPFLEALNGGDGEALQAAGGLNRVSARYHGGRSMLRNYAAGGLFQERIDAAKDWLDDAEGMPYVWGGTVTPSLSGTDCSGMQAAVTHILSGRSPYSGRIGTTATMPWGGFVRGLTSAYAIGNKPSDHMAATLDGDNVEQHGPSGTPFDFPSRWGADASYFNQQWSLPIVGGQFASGGNGNDGWMTGRVKSIFDDVTNPLIDAIRGLVGDPPPQWRAVPVGVATRGRDLIRDWLFGEAAEQEAANGAMDVSGISGPVVDQVRQVAAMYGWDQGPEWTAISQLVNKESSWDPNAANRTSSARGLFQKMTSLHGAVESTAAGQAAWGLDYIKGKYGTPSAAWAYHLQHNSYDSGGYLQPGSGAYFNGTSTPEPVLTSGQWADISTLAARGGGQLEGRLYLDDGTFLGVVRGAVDEQFDSLADSIDNGTR